MIIAPEHIYGIDSQINLIQRDIDERLSDLWKGSLKVYGRAIVTEKDETKRLEFWNGTDYKELLVDDRTDASVGFKINSRPIESDRLLSEIDIIFTVNVTNISTERTYVDEKVLIQALNIINLCGYCGQVTAIKIGVDEVFNGFETENIKHRDMAPYHIFSFSTNIEYYSNICE